MFAALERKHDTLGKHAHDDYVVMMSGFSVVYQNANIRSSSVSSEFRYSGKCERLSGLELSVD
jgi:hypothetical protein